MDAPGPLEWESLRLKAVTCSRGPRAHQSHPCFRCFGSATKYSSGQSARGSPVRLIWQPPFLLSYATDFSINIVVTCDNGVTVRRSNRCYRDAPGAECQISSDTGRAARFEEVNNTSAVGRSM